MNSDAPDSHLPFAYFSIAMIVVSVLQLSCFVIIIVFWNKETRTGSNIRIRPICSRVNFIVLSIGISFLVYWATKAWIQFEAAKDVGSYTYFTFSTLPLIKASLQTIQYGFLLRSRDRSVEIIDSLSPPLFKGVQVAMKIVAILTYVPVLLSLFVACNFSLDADIKIRLVVRGVTIVSIVGAIGLDVTFLTCYILFLEKTKRTENSIETVDTAFLIVARYGVLTTALFFVSMWFQFMFFATNNELWDLVATVCANLVFGAAIGLRVSLYWERIRKLKEGESKLERVLGCELAAIRERGQKIRPSKQDLNETVVSIPEK
ncbi:hypothetical protein BCR33DRAFT_767953 [Rhizoclosmatium globosum]|uniref:Uncharacterized protein n=1 Tax=Rhizoclosmatium globosum TaxID=329046 RepID=A0A1Y2C1I0_9FUNG|nr:hypothetical protein BCR33DRAFT_767953 [Rhizoclosmatium globosum]|eukprot:ORY40816.1 hypothetical protein BCR33DRAFT_767953 [Rhizoclosmatium globosum]